MNKAIIKTVFISSKQGMEKELRECLREIVRHTREEKGCVQFEVHENMNESGEFILWEHFVDKQALDDHLDQPYMKKYFEIKCFEATSAIPMLTLK